MLKNGINGFRGKRVLLLQGPVGPFFRRLAYDLEQAGAKVFKVNFNGGDWLFYRTNAFSYRSSLKEWPEFLESLLKQLNIEVVMLFGDCRPIHRVAHQIAQGLDIEIGVFEEGYVRPDYVTFERFGVNAHSLIPRTPIFYLNSPIPKVKDALPLGNTFWPSVVWTILYYLSAITLKPLFIRYEHHRPLVWTEGLLWLRSIWRKWFYAVKEHGVEQRLVTEDSGRYFLVPLQVHNDSQIHTHSDFDSIDDFISNVMSSFARNAPRNTILVIKHHPMDRGYNDYRRYIAERTKELGLNGRCYYIHDQHLPTLLKHTRGVIVVNSTVGLSALLHNAPVTVCGSAIYDMKGLTFQGSLNQFWRRAKHSRPNRNLLERFVSYLVLHTQINGSFYKKLESIGTATGLRWPDSKNSLNTENDVKHESQN